MTAAIGKMDTALVASQIPEDITVFRGMPAEALPKDAVGTEFTDKAYGSTSLDYKTAEKFGRWVREDGLHPAIIEIRVPKGNDGIYMENLWDNGEYEVLLPRGTKYKVVSEIQKPLFGIAGGVRYLTVEVVK